MEDMEDVEDMEDTEDMEIVENEAEGVRSDFIDKHPIYLEESYEVLLSNQQFCAQFVPAEGMILEFPISNLVHEWYVTVSSNTAYLVIVTSADRFIIEYDVSGLEENEMPARIYVIALQQMVNFDIPLRANRDFIIIATPGITYTFAQYYAFAPLHTLDVNWPSHALHLDGVENSSYQLAMLENTKLKLTVASLSYIHVMNSSRRSMTELEAIPDLQQIILLPLNDSWSDDICNVFTTIVNKQLQAPVIDRPEHVILQNMTLSRISIRSGTEIMITMENPSPNIVDRYLVVTAGEKYILICNNDDRFRIVCAPGIIEREAVVRVIAMETTPHDFVVPLRPNRTTFVVMVHNKEMMFAMIPSYDNVDYEAMANFLQEFQYRDYSYSQEMQLYREENMHIGRCSVTTAVFNHQSKTLILNIHSGVEEMPQP